MPRARSLGWLPTFVSLTVACLSCADSGNSGFAAVDLAVGPVDLTPGPPAPNLLAPASTLTSCLAVDGNGVYWADQGQGNRVLKVGLSGGTPVTLATGGDSRTCVAIDAVNAYYYSRDNDGGAGDTIWKVPLDGSGQPSMVAGNQHVKNGFTAAGGFVYFVTDLYGPLDMAFSGMDAIVRIPVAGGAAEVLFADIMPAAAGLAVDGNNLYFSDQSGVYARPIAGGNNTSFGMSNIHGNPFAVGGGHLVMIEVTSIGMGSLVLYNLDGGNRTVLIDKLVASPLALDDKTVYAKQNNQLVRFPLDGKAPATVSLTAARAVALDAANIYFTDGASILKLAR